jgi:hypothetical protein
MASKSQAIGDGEIEKIINKLIKEYEMSIECLAHLLGVKNHGDNLMIPTKFEKRCSFINVLLMLDNISKDEADFKFEAFLGVLIEFHKISADTIAKFAKVPK